MQFANIYLLYGSTFSYLTHNRPQYIYNNNILDNYNNNILICNTGDNGRIEYTITAGDEHNDFVIAANGTIRTKRLVDRETKSSYNLIVTAKDCAMEPEKRLSSTVQVIIIKIT